MPQTGHLNDWRPRRIVLFSILRLRGFFFSRLCLWVLSASLPVSGDEPVVLPTDRPLSTFLCPECTSDVHTAPEYEGVSSWRECVLV